MSTPYVPLTVEKEWKALERQIKKLRGKNYEGTIHQLICSLDWLKQRRKACSSKWKAAQRPAKTSVPRTVAFTSDKAG